LIRNSQPIGKAQEDQNSRGSINLGRPKHDPIKDFQDEVRNEDRAPVPRKSTAQLWDHQKAEDDLFRKNYDRLIQEGKVTPYSKKSEVLAFISQENEQLAAET